MNSMETVTVETPSTPLEPRVRHIPLGGLHNLRDLGGYAAGDGLETRWGLLYRSDSPHRIKEEGLAELERRGVHTVIDLRHAAELERSPNPLAHRAGYYNLPLFAGLRPDPSVMVSLESLYAAALEDCAEPLRQVVEAVVNSEGATLVHCTAGKDRTGLVVALLLLSVGVSEDDVVADYALTAHHAKSLLEELLEETRAAGGDTERYAVLLSALPETMQATLHLLNSRYGGARAYLTSIGVDSEQLERLEKRWVGGFEE